MSLVKHVPNIITSIGLFSGFLAVSVFIGPGTINYNLIAILILIALIADFMDGFSARALNAGSAIGKQLDSLSDLISFGVVPGLLAYSYLSSSHANIYGAAISAIIPVFSAWRLARFNVEDEGDDNFKGLPTPANAIFYVGLMFFDESSFMRLDVLLLVFILALSSLMVSDLKMFSLKFKNYGWQGNQARWLFLLACVGLLAFFQFEGITLCIIAYIFASLINNSFNR